MIHFLKTSVVDNADNAYFINFLLDCVVFKSHHPFITTPIRRKL